VKILLTGATGFIGARVARRLAAAHQVYCVVRRADAALPAQSIPIVIDLAAALGRGDLRNALRDALPGRIDAVLHLAQSHRYREFPDEAGAIFAVNTAATAALLEYAADAGAARFVLASTGTVYEPYGGRLAEDAPVSPASFYSATKLAAEALLQGWRSRLGGCALRLFFPYGPGQIGRLVPQLVERIRAKTAVTLAGSGDGLVLAPTFVDDIALVFEAALEGEWNGIFNVAAPHPVSLRQLAEDIGRVIGIEPRFAPTGAAQAPRIVPELGRLSECYDLSRFRPLTAGLAEALA
jgi:nucleoside-diphosphate-sugar epimerase